MLISITHTLLEHTFKYIYELYNENKTLLRGLVNVECHFAGKQKNNSSQSTLTRSFHSLALELWICIERSKSVDITANVEWNWPIDLISVTRKESFINARHQYYTEQAMSFWAASRCVAFLIEYLCNKIVSTHLGLSIFFLVCVNSKKKILY